MIIGILSDTHGYLDDAILKHLNQTDEIWHAGDFGSVEVSDTLSNIKPLKGVYGNIDGQTIRKIHPLVNIFDFGGLKVYMTHIGGYPGHYAKGVLQHLRIEKPDIFICGHSHILKVMRDPSLNQMLCINPGAAGKHGFHIERTLIKLEVSNGKPVNLDVVELGKRAKL